MVPNTEVAALQAWNTCIMHATTKRKEGKPQGRIRWEGGRVQRWRHQIQRSIGFQPHRQTWPASAVVGLALVARVWPCTLGRRAEGRGRVCVRRGRREGERHGERRASGLARAPCSPGLQRARTKLKRRTAPRPAYGRSGPFSPLFHRSERGGAGWGRKMLEGAVSCIGCRRRIERTGKAGDGADCWSKKKMVYQSLLVYCAENNDLWGGTKAAGCTTLVV
jgi:hypothetical protein